MSNRSWQRLVLSLIGVAIIAGMWRWALNHLYTLDPAAFTAFTSLTTNAFFSISAIVIFMVTGKLVYEWRNNTISSAINSAATSKERVEYVERELRPRDKEEDESEI